MLKQKKPSIILTLLLFLYVSVHTICVCVLCVCIDRERENETFSMSTNERPFFVFVSCFLFLSFFFLFFGVLVYTFYLFCWRIASSYGPSSFSSATARNCEPVNIDYIGLQLYAFRLLCTCASKQETGAIDAIWSYCTKWALFTNPRWVSNCCNPLCHVYHFFVSHSPPPSLALNPLFLFLFPSLSLSHLSLKRDRRVLLAIIPHCFSRGSFIDSAISPCCCLCAPLT